MTREILRKITYCLLELRISFTERLVLWHESGRDKANERLVRLLYKHTHERIGQIERNALAKCRKKQDGKK